MGESQEGATYLFFLKKENEKWYDPLCSPSTHNTDLADEYFAGQEEITLQEVESFNSESNNTFTIVIVAALLLGILAASIWILSGNKRRGV